ncbi:Peptidase T [invertebrate metagenome]|uniref:Peptidase T n=1 Tax=invertebrate metagenome TaxID=1711999 RepID=A0A2H9T9N0_9ZZZZ
MKEQFLKHFLDYIAFNTQSNPDCENCPSTHGQKVLGEHLRAQLDALHLQDVKLDENGYIMAKLPANTDKPVPAIGFIAHMDTAPDASGENVKAKIHENYDGSDIILHDGMMLSPNEFPFLPDYKGKTLITSDGTTLLGADNKAGVAAIMTAIEYLLEHPEVTHGDICVGFTPDEEIGRGANLFNVEAFGAQWAYTIDGDALGGLEYENFNAAGAEVICHGRNVHPGTAKNVMVNAMTLARKFANELPADEVPEHTENHEGFFHLHHMEGDETEARLSYLIRDHDRDRYEHRKQLMESIADSMNKQLDESRIELVIKDSYFNMREQVEKVPHVVDIAKEAMQACDVEPVIKPIRGGTDGARLSFMNLPTPNIFTGGMNFHGPYEFLCLESAVKSIETIINICRITAERY